MEEKNCRGCEYREVGFEGKFVCRLAHDFVAKLSDFCPKEHTIEEIKKRCSWYVPPEQMNDGESCCTAHLAEGRAFTCCIKEFPDLLKDPDFEIKSPAVPRV